MCNTGFWQVLHIPCNTAILMHAVGMHYVMSLFDRYVLQPATIGTGEALLAQYMSMLLMEMSFSGSSTLFTSVRASPKSGPVQVSAILRILVCAILSFLQVLHILQYVQYWLFPSIAHTIVCAILPFPEYPKVSRYPCASRVHVTHTRHDMHTSMRTHPDGTDVWAFVGMSRRVRVRSTSYVHVLYSQ